MGERSRNSREKHRKTKPQRTWIRCGFLVGAGGLRESVRIHPLYEFSLVTKQKPQRT